MVPAITFTKESLPTNGSATVLNTYAASGASASHLTRTSLPSASVATSEAASAAEGNTFLREVIKSSTPLRVMASPQ